MPDSSRAEPLRLLLLNLTFLATGVNSWVFLRCGWGAILFRLAPSALTLLT
jgi:hypothetical protein